MIGFFYMSGDLRILILTLLCIGLLLQGYSVAYGFFRFRYELKNLCSLLVDLSILCLLGLFVLYGAEATSQIRSGVCWVRTYPSLRIGLFLAIAVTSMGKFISLGHWQSLLTIPAAALTLPWMERIAGEKFGIVLSLMICYWLTRSVAYLHFYGMEREKNLSAFSVKEALDTMEFGIMLCKGPGESAGQILLINSMMMNLMYRLTGKLLYSGKEFYELLQNSQVVPACHRKGDDSAVMYTLEDESVWRFDQQFLMDENKKYVFITASDITRYSWTMDQLGQQNQELKIRNQELKDMLRNMESLCRTEETVRTKSRVHDVLGQQISLILRSVREHREPDEKLLQPFRDGLPQQLRNAVQDCGNSLRMVAKSFQSLGVRVSIDGKLPGTPEIQKVLYEVAAEAMTNAVYHGYASKIQINFSHTGGQCRMRIRDNGKVKNLPIQEGGGLRSMRRKVEELGGQFSYSTREHFSILVSIPEENVT